MFQRERSFSRVFLPGTPLQLCWCVYCSLADCWLMIDQGLHAGGNAIRWQHGHPLCPGTGIRYGDRCNLTAGHRCQVGGWCGDPLAGGVLGLTEGVGATCRGVLAQSRRWHPMQHLGVDMRRRIRPHVPGPQDVHPATSTHTCIHMHVCTHT